MSYSTASGNNSLSFGAGTTTSKEYAIALGNNITGNGNYSFATGYYSKTEGDYSQAFGSNNTANGSYSTAFGNYNTANGLGQFVIGEYNNAETITDNTKRGKYAFIIGNGTYSARSNAHTVDWDGTGWFAGGIKIGGTSQDDTAALSVLTSADVESITDDEINSICGAVIYLANEVAL